MKMSDVPTPGKPRQILAFELRMNIIADATIDLLFTKNRVWTGSLFLMLCCPLSFSLSVKTYAQFSVCSYLLFILILFTGDKCHSCECWCRFLSGGQHPNDCRRKWYLLPCFVFEYLSFCATRKRYSILIEKYYGEYYLSDPVFLYFFLSFILSICLPIYLFFSGYSPTVKGQLLHVDTTSSMQYRTLLEAEMLAVRTTGEHSFACIRICV